MKYLISIAVANFSGTLQSNRDFQKLEEQGADG